MPDNIIRPILGIPNPKATHMPTRKGMPMSTIMGPRADDDSPS
ncbi:MAG: hypothetical protein VB860_10250 [Dehalococcoidia bacterium]